MEPLELFLKILFPIRQDLDFIGELYFLDGKTFDMASTDELFKSLNQIIFEVVYKNWWG